MILFNATTKRGTGNQFLSKLAKINITELFSNVFADNCHNGIKSSSISMDV